MARPLRDVVDRRGEAFGGEYPEIGLRAVDNEFEARAVRIDPGVTIEWENQGRAPHDIVPVADGARFGVAADDFQPGDTHEFRFDDPGVYEYFCSLHGSRTAGMRGTIVVGDGPLDASEQQSAPRGPARTVRVPEDARTIQGAVDVAPPGSLVLVGPGVYHETVTVTTPRLVIRGLDRNRTILDGRFELDNGIKVLADGVAVENLTARNYLVNGVFWSGVTGYRASYLTAVNNQLYGVYAFDSRRGRFEHSYASGSSDSGFYVGQCNPCDALLVDLVAERNQLGFSGANATGDLSIVESVWRGNRGGIILATLDSEQLAPQGDAFVAGNLVDGTDAASASVRSDRFLDVLYGVGIAVVGGHDDRVVANRVVAADKLGIGVAPNPQLGENFWPATGNRVERNVVTGSGLADLGILPVPDAGGNCFAQNTFTTSGPVAIETALPCTGPGSGDLQTGALDFAPFLDTSANPEGLPFRQQPAPPPQRRMPRARTARAVPAVDVDVNVDLDTVGVP